MRFFFCLTLMLGLGSLQSDSVRTGAFYGVDVQASLETNAVALPASLTSPQALRLFSSTPVFPRVDGTAFTVFAQLFLTRSTKEALPRHPFRVRDSFSRWRNESWPLRC